MRKWEAAAALLDGKSCATCGNNLGFDNKNKIACLHGKKPKYPTCDEWEEKFTFTSIAVQAKPRKLRINWSIERYLSEEINNEMVNKIDEIVQIRLLSGVKQQ